ncbi:hypothetical protein ACVWW4_004060 [Bradyrhizobium sp. LB7.1]
MAVATLGDADFAACHVKSNEQHGYNRQWQNARAEKGHEDVVIHRGKLTPAFCKSLLSTALTSQPQYPFADVQHGSQPVPDFLLDVLDNKMLLPSSRMAPQPVSLNGETYSIALGPQGRRDAQLIHHPGPSSVPDARIGASRASASAGDRSGRVLAAREWLGDEHIQRDYELLSQELWQSTPDLAARTRFVDPLTAFQVGQGSEVDALRAFHRIVDDRNGNDTADFLFLPVNDASATDLSCRDSHWSLLLVDRRDRDRPVAYHYDSAGGHNARPAAMLAARVGADLRDAPIRRQGNGYDCGVFVVDGTRELVRRLAGRRQTDLNLGNLVVDRQALQNRLRG